VIAVNSKVIDRDSSGIFYTFFAGKAREFPVCADENIPFA
jgi:hypothetical protein